MAEQRPQPEFKIDREDGREKRDQVEDIDRSKPADVEVEEVAEETPRPRARKAIHIV